MLALLANLLIIPAAIMAIGYALRVFATKAVPVWLLRLWLLPGVVVHEMSHAAACFPALATIKDISINARTASGAVVHEEPRLKFIGPLMISLAPVVGGLFLLWGLDYLLASPVRYSTIEAGTAAQSYVFPWLLLKIAFQDILLTLQHGPWLDWRAWLMAYCIVSISLTLVPSVQDMKNCIVGALVIGGITAVVWLVLEHVLKLHAGKAIAGFVSWLLAKAHIILFYFIIDAALLLALAAIGASFRSVSSGSRSKQGQSAKKS